MLWESQGYNAPEPLRYLMSVMSTGMKVASTLCRSSRSTEQPEIVYLTYYGCS